MSKSKGTPRNPRINFHFKRPEFDFMFQWILGAQTNGGVEVGECFHIGGGDTFVEDLYAYIGPAGNKRGYHVLMVDLPGQGLLPFEGMTWRNDSEAPMRAVVDYALGRPEVDGEKLAAYGISGGGYLVPRAVTCEKRIKACVGCSIILDLTQAWNSRWIDLYEKAEHSLLYRLAKALVVRWRSAYATMVDTCVWRFGASSVQDLILVTKTAQVDPAQITCPTLNIMSEQEYAESPQFRGFAEVCQKKISHPIKKLVVITACLVSAVIATALGYVINRYTKLSLHSAAMAGCTAVLLLTAPLIGAVMAVFAPLVGWARIRLKHHTPFQILIGWMVSMVCVFVVFRLML